MITARELFRELEKEGLADVPLVYPNWMYRQPYRYLAHVDGWEKVNDGLFLTIDTAEAIDVIANLME